MSAHVVDNECMVRCVAGIAMTVRRFANFDTRTQQRELGQLLFQMNADAVGQRYQEPQVVPIYNHKTLAATASVQFYKALECLRYQCAEGNVVKSDLFRELVLVSRQLAEKIVHSLPAYERARWG